MHKSSKKQTELEQQLGELTADLQRVQADFVNYRRRIDDERMQLTDAAKAATIIKLLPLLDDIERATKHVPSELTSNAWAKGIVNLGKRFEKSLQELGLVRIDATPGTLFDPQKHEAVSMDDGEGDEEVISEELRAGYVLGSQVVRPSMVKVTRRQATAPDPKKLVQEELQQELPDQPKAED